VTSRSATRLLLACRASATDGLGHLIRTRALAERIPASVDAELVVIGDALAAPLLEGLGVPAAIVDQDDALLEHAAAMQPEAVVLDMMSLDAAVFSRLADRALTVSLSPVFDHLDAVDLAFNRTRYEAAGLATAPNRRYGLEYAIVRSNVDRIDTGLFRRQLARERLAVAVSMGGADAPNRTLRVLEGLRSLPAPATFWVLLGEGYGHSYHELVDAVRLDRRHEVILAKTNQSMWTILGNCSLAILAGGVTTYEAVYAGLPSINLFTSESHGFLVRELEEAGTALNGGLFDDEGLARLDATVAALGADRDRLFDMHVASRGLLDEHGADRVLGEVLTAVRARSRAAQPA
jgi:spore coat polysaccharide biosynthesis predicted glycosyltransferase SpsG